MKKFEELAVKLILVRQLHFFSQPTPDTEEESINILKGISTSFECGQLTGIMGPSGIVQSQVSKLYTMLIVMCML